VMALLLALWVLAMGNSEEYVSPVFDALELALTPKTQQYRVGQIFVFGNERTSSSVILEQLDLCPGMRLYWWRMRLAETRLILLGFFEVDPKRSQRPRVTALDPFEDGEFRDIEVRVSEKKQQEP
jgi:outer membrane protein assembly factor BamA